MNAILNMLKSTTQKKVTAQASIVSIETEIADDQVALSVASSDYRSAALAAVEGGDKERSTEVSAQQTVDGITKRLASNGAALVAARDRQSVLDNDATSAAAEAGCRR